MSGSIKGVLTSRRVRAGANVVSVSLIIAAIWGMVNYLNFRHHHRFDLTFTHQFSLSDKTKKVLEQLEEPLRITTLYRQGTLLYRQVRDLLEEYAVASRMVQVENIDAERDPARVEELAKRLNLDALEMDTVIFEYGGRSKHVSRSEVEERQYNPYGGQTPPPEFKGEEAFTSAILNVSQEKQTVLYFVSGHGEKDIEGFRQNGISNLVKLLRRDNFKVEKLVLLGRKDVPEDCDVLIICGPERNFSEEEKQLLHTYLEKGGKLLVMIDPLATTGLETLLAKWKVKLGNDIVIDPVNRIPFVGPTTLFVSDYSYHEVTEKMRGMATILPLARSVDVEPSSMSQKLRAVTLMRTSDRAWGETNFKEREAQFDPDSDKRGPVSLGVAVSDDRKAALPEKEGAAGGMRLVVLGDSDSITNMQLSNVGNTDLFLNSVNWLAEKEKLISIRPRSPDIRKVVMSANQNKSIFLSSVVGLPLLAVVCGVGMWWKRRK